ncbi:glutathione S-transferase [Penicillium verhagenii]|nr:glutathione S-transferase [Penicillium verhagenii]
MVLQLHGFAHSTCTNRVRTVLEEKGVEVEFIPVNLAQGEQKAESYLNDLHPFGKVPVLRDTETGVQVFGKSDSSLYILLGSRKLPGEPAVSVEQSYFDPIVSQIAFEKVFKGMKGLGPADEARVAALLSQLDATLQGYERILSKQKYLAGDSVTLADLYHLPYGAFVEKFGFAELVDKYPAFKKWWEGLKNRESWKKLSQ